MATEVVEVVLEVSITNTELELLDEVGIIHQIQSIEDIKVKLLGEDECVTHELIEFACGGDVVIGVGRFEGIVLWVTNDGGRERVETAEIGDLTRIIGDDICVDDAIPRHEPILELCEAEDRMEAELIKVVVEELTGRLGVLHLHRADALELRLLRDCVELLCHLHGHARRETREPNADELLWVEGAVVVAADRDRFRENDSSGVDSLPDIKDVHTTSDL